MQLLTEKLPEDVEGWWVSEKYDGIRAIWTGTKLISRQGIELNPPAHFVKGLPSDVRLDGELCKGRGTFDNLVSVLQKKDSDWDGVLFMVFDLAEEGTFEARYDRLMSMHDLPMHVVPVVHFRLINHADLDRLEYNIFNNGGEGCVIRRPGHLYRPGRSGDVIKVRRLADAQDASRRSND